MKQTLKRRICAAILCPILLLGLAGCSKANKAKPNDGGDPPVKASIDALKQGQPAADSEETANGAESLARVRGDLEYDTAGSPARRPISAYARRATKPS